MNESEYLLAQQFKYLRKVKRMKMGKLRHLHDSTFAGTKYSVRIPKWMHRGMMERRLFFYFCMRNYHYPKGSQIRKEFRRKAKHILSRDYIDGLDPAQVAKQTLKEGLNFTATHIKAMPIVEVDRYLASLSLFVEGPQHLRRKVLWEWFNKPSQDLIPHFNDRGKRVRKTGPLNNKYNLRDLILQHPSLPYEDFEQAFGDQMPTVTRNSYNATRSTLRKAGYDIPRLHFGRQHPNVIRGEYGQLVRGKTLNDTSLVNVENHGQEESF